MRSLSLTYGVRFDKPLYFDTATKIQENIGTKGGVFDTADFNGGSYQEIILFLISIQILNEEVFLDSQLKCLPTGDMVNIT